MAEKFGMIVSALVIAFVGINILLVFGSFMGIQVKDFTGVTGSSTTICKNDVGGINCRGVFYPMKPYKEDACPQGSAKTCTNACQIESAMAQDGRICPTYCIDYCLSDDVANLLKTK
ncbi:MAG: hypothetical protein AABX75_03215 [Nanoarchaeota archaeon]